MGSGLFGHRLKKTKFVTAAVVVAVLFAIVGDGLCSQNNNGKEVSRSYVRKLRYINSETAKEMLTSLGIGKEVNRLAETNAVIITTSDPADQVKAESILSLIDSKIRYEVRNLVIGALANKMPDTEMINENVMGIEIGSFTSPPRGEDVPLAIVDMHDGDMIAIAPKGLIRPISRGFIKARNEAEESNTFKNINPENRIVSVAKTNTSYGKSIDNGEQDHENSFARALKEFRLAEKELAESRNNLDKNLDKEIEKEIDNVKPVSAELAEKDFLSDKLLNTLKNAEDKTEKKEEKSETNTKSVVKEAVKETAETAKKAETEKTEAKAVEKTNQTPESTKTPAKAGPKKAVDTKSAQPVRATPVANSTRKASPVKPAANKTAQPTKAAPSGKEAPKTNLPDNPNMDPELKKALEMLMTIDSANTKPEKTQNSNLQEKATEKTPVVPNIKVPERRLPENSVPQRKAQEKSADKVEDSSSKQDPSSTETPKASSKFPEGLSDAELETVINIPKKVAIAELLKLVGVQLGLNYMYDENEIRGDVTLFINNGKIKVRELYALVESILKFKGFVMTRGSGNLVNIVPISRTQDIDPEFIDNVSDIKVGDVVVSKIFKLKYIDTTVAEKMLKEMKLSLSIQSIPENSTMIITGYAYRMDRIQKVLDMVDLPGKKRIFRERVLIHTIPSSLADKIDTLAKELGTISISISSQVTATEPTPTRASPAKSAAVLRAEAARKAAAARSGSNSSISTGNAPKEGVFLDIDDRTNRILMIGLKEDIEVVEELINTLDVPQQGLKVIKQYKIENIDASIVIDILNEVGAASGGARPVTTPSSTTASKAGKSTTTRTATTTSRGASSGEGPQISLLVDTNTLLVNGTPEEHDQISMVISLVDKPNPDERTITEYEIKNVDATEVVETLGELGIVTPQMSGYGNSRYSSRSSSRTSPAASRTAAPPEPMNTSSSFSEPLADEPQIAVLETTNSLLINATIKQHASIAMVIAHVDREPEQNSTPYVIYPLENQDPEELKPILDELVNATIAAKTQGKTGVAGAPTSTSKIQTTTGSSGGGLRNEDERITIVSDPATYSLVVYASKKNQGWIGKLVDELDAYRPQVLLDVTLVEVSKNDDFSYDLNVLSSIPDLNATSGLINLVPGENPTTAKGILDRLMERGRSQFIEGASNSGNFTGFFGNEKIMALFEAMQRKNYGRILAKPKLLVDDNQEGSIETKNTVYIERKTITKQTTDTGNNTLLGENVEFEPYDASIALSIKPHISKGENLRLEIELTRSDFLTATDASTTKPPDQAESNVLTVATVPNNHTIILGGMDRVNQSKGGTKVPILGDIPLIGGFFRSTANTSSQRKLYIFVKAHILRPGEELSASSDIINISKRHRREFEDYEEEMQKYEDWPGIKPKPMDPLKILEEDDKNDFNNGNKVVIEVNEPEME